MDSSLVHAFEEESWEELMDGKLIAMSPRPLTAHNLVAWNVYGILAG